MMVRLRRLAAAAVGIIPLLAGGRAEAQFGWGFGLYNPENASIEARALNQRSLAAGNAAYAARSSIGGGFGSYGSNPNAYWNTARDVNFFEKYDAQTRQSMESRVARRPSSSLAPTTPVTTPAAIQPVLALGSFFNRYGELVWPAEAPTAGDLTPLRATSDKASQAVLKDVKQSGVSQIGTVTDARAKLLDYGRPALQYVRTNATPRIADTFHLFLLSLYEALAQAANPPKTGSSTAPPPVPVNRP